MDADTDFPTFTEIDDRLTIMQAYINKQAYLMVDLLIDAQHFIRELEAENRKLRGLD